MTRLGSEPLVKNVLKNILGLGKDVPCSSPCHLWWVRKLILLPLLSCSTLESGPLTLPVRAGELTLSMGEGDASELPRECKHGRSAPTTHLPHGGVGGIPSIAACSR